jgi:hypothetical protein
MNVVIAVVLMMHCVVSPTVMFADDIELHRCSDAKLGVRFYCNPDWELVSEGDSMLMIISEDPVVTLTIAKSEQPVIFLDQLTEDVLQEIGQYADGFGVSRVWMANQEAVQVIGHHRWHPETQLIDHYLIHDVDLYSVLISISPKESVRDYENLLNIIVEHFEFKEEAL